MPSVYNQNIEIAFRSLMTTFRLAGVESQTVEEVIKQFSYIYYEHQLTFTDKEMFLFSDKEEAYEVTYLLMMVHTTKHNENMEDMVNLK